MTDIYQDSTGHPVDKQYTISILTEDKPGLLNTVTIVFTRRNINIDMINVSASEIEGVSRYTIALTTNKDQVEKNGGNVDPDKYQQQGRSDVVDRGCAHHPAGRQPPRERA